MSAGPQDDRAEPPPAEAASQADRPAASSGAATEPESPSAAELTPQAAEAIDEIYRVQLDVFEGPLDLLLHLIQKHELDIFDIPVSFVTKKYLEYLDWMQTLQIDVASEYLVMAATLAYIKSQMLLPEPPREDGEGEGLEVEDPRAELVRRLLEYQKYKDAAQQLGGRSLLDRDVFERGGGEPPPEGIAPFAPVSVFKLFEAFDDVLRRAKRTIDHEVMFERISLAERIVELTELLHDRGRLRFEQLFEHARSDGEGPPPPPSRFELVVTFLALLEMTKLGVAQVIQESPLGALFVEFAARDAALPITPADLERLEDGDPAAPVPPCPPASGASPPVEEPPVEPEVEDATLGTDPHAASGAPASDGPAAHEPEDDD